ncbi:membrin-11-like [Phalaenopsis equestris]|uniref:membrin-11-like n=1 Tax=Phalaenopsis equestris TaxID=78828 RepID=UPI0009E1EF24|nr:membrin-11-like [Phalaenopsis equestris]XP_020579850.1 membrin-11-like [Phalaenopsis equestris]XP_020579851.1 membrin-11-like [Phalaenopsis equestris]
MEAAAGGGGTLSELYQNARRLLLRTRDALVKLERLDSSSFSSSSSYTSQLSSSATSAGVGLDPAELSLSIRRDVTQVQSLCAEMDRLSRSIGAKGQRELWKRKVEHVAEEANSLRESLDKHALKQQKKIQEAKERADLLGRANGESEHFLRIFDEEAQAMQSARNSHMMLDEAYATGVAVLSKYAEQRDRLKRAQRKALDVLNTVGLSNSVLKLIERRHRVDKWIAYGGMMITVVVMYMFWRWTH